MLVINLVGKLWSTLISLFSLFGTYQIQRTAQSIFLFWNLLHQILPAVGALVGCSLEAFFVSELPPAFVPSIGISLHFSSLVRSHLSQLSRIHLGICLPGSSSLVPILHTSCKAGGCKPSPGLSLEQASQPPGGFLNPSMLGPPPGSESGALYFQLALGWCGCCRSGISPLLWVSSGTRGSVALPY